MSKLVSIIVPCYKQAHFLEESLQSVINQTYNNWECIIVNDGSPDNTQEVAGQWCDKDDRFKYIYQKNSGLSSARNTGIKESNGEFILPLDADDILHMELLAKLVPALEEDDKLGVVSCYSSFFEGNISNIIHRTKPVGTTYHALLFENIMIATSMYRKKSWQRVGGYDEQMKNGFEDWEFWIAITKGGLEFKFIEEYLFYYRKSKKSMLTDTLEHHRIFNLEYVFKKHKELYVKHFDNSMEYMFFLVKMYRNSELKIKSTSEYKIARFIGKPFRLFNKFMKK